MATIGKMAGPTAMTPVPIVRLLSPPAKPPDQQRDADPMRPRPHRHGDRGMSRRVSALKKRSGRRINRCDRQG